MRRNRKPLRYVAVVTSVSCLVGLALAGSASAASTVLTFREPVKGSTGSFIDNAPKSRAGKFSAGDEVIFTNTLEVEGKIVGKIRAVCIATESSRSVIVAGFFCTALAKIPGGTLVLVAPLSESGTGTEGAVTGGTGKYAGARGTFVVEEGRRSDTNTITLLE